MRVLVPMLVFLFMIPCVGYSQEHQQEHFKTTLNQYIQEAVENNPTLLEAKQQINVFKEIPSQRSSLKDPMLMIGLMNLPVDTFSFRQEPMTQKQVQIVQEFPYPGKLGLKSDAAKQDVKIAEETYDDLKLDITQKVKVSFFELCFVSAAIETTEQNKVLLEQFVTIAESKYAVGKGIQQDVLKAQVELSKIMDRLIELRQLKKIETARLNTLMNRLPQNPLKVPHGISKTVFNYTVEDLQAMAEENRPVLQGIRAAIEKMKIKKQLAKKEYYPDFQVGLRYGQRQDSPFRDNPDFVSGYVGINIPIWHKTKQDRKVAEEGYRIRVAQETYRKTRNHIFENIQILLDRGDKSSQQIVLFKTGIIPQAKQSLESALAAYSVDKIDFLTLIDSQVTLLNWEIKYHRELTSYEQNLAKLEKVVGHSLIKF